LGDKTNLSASITPDPATVCAGSDLNLNGGPSGGSGIWSTHLWTGSGSDTCLRITFNTYINSSSFGSFNLTYTVTDSEGCSASDNISSLTVNPIPAITWDMSIQKY